MYVSAVGSHSVISGGVVSMMIPVDSVPAEPPPSVFRLLPLFDENQEQLPARSVTGLLGSSFV